jgi:hypothetical protein
VPKKAPKKALKRAENRVKKVSRFVRYSELLGC